MDQDYSTEKLSALSDEKSRLTALAELVRAENADAMLLTGEVSLIYATGVTALEGMCVIFADGTALFSTDGRYIEVADKQLTPQGFTVLCRKTAVPVSSWLSQVITEHGVRRLMYEDGTLTVAEFAHIRETLPDGIEYLPASGKLGTLRACKTPREIGAIIKAQRIAERAFDTLLPMLHNGITEREAAAKLNYFMAMLGSEKPSFDTIMLFGENTSKPHGTPGDRQLRPGDFITMDFGAVYQGYHSDMTRTVAYGYATDEMRRVYDIVLRAQAAAEAVALEGLRCCDMHFAAADVIAEAGYGEYFTHALGHTVGLEIHEYPVAAPRCETLLQTGMVMTDEPGIYIAGKFGVRIEDMLVIDGQKPRNITRAKKEFWVLPEKKAES